MKKPISVGGQALIEGIMMKGPEKTAIAVRTPDKKIDVEYFPEKHIKDSFKPAGWPIIRGVVNFVESMIIGYKALMISADKSGLTDFEEETDKNSAAADDSEEAKALAEKKKKSADRLITAVMIVGVVLGVLLAMALFMYLPAAIFDLIKHFSGESISPTRPLFEGVLKIAIFVGYVALVSMTKDIKRVFMYHGAEHKTIFCFEKGEELTVENVRKNSRFHPRCGTSFMILMLIVGILLSFIIVTLFPGITKIRLLWVSVKLLMVPIICGIGYELIKICGRHDNALTRFIAAPGLWVQRLTTKEPEDDMIEVAIESLKAVLPADLLPGGYGENDEVAKAGEEN